MNLKKLKIKELIGRSGIFKDGDWIESKDQDLNGDIRLIQMADIGVGIYKNKSQKFMTHKSFKKLNCTEVKKDDILISRMPEPIGRACIFEGDNKKCVTVVDISILRVDPNIVNNRWLLYRINSKDIRKQIELKATGTTRKRIARSKLGELEILLPPIEIQIKIAEALDKAQELIDNRKLQLEKYDELIQSTFIDMFGDPVLNTKKWKLKKIGEVSSCIVPGRDKPKSFTGKIPWITTPDLIKNGVTFTSKKNIGLTKEEIQTVKAKLIPVNSVVMSCVGDLGITTLVGKEMIINQQLHAFICNNNLNPYFLRAVIPYQKNYMYSVATTTTIPYLNKSNCNNIPIILPPIELQNKFASIVKIIENEKKLCEESLKQMEENFNSMIDKAFKGELF